MEIWFDECNIEDISALDTYTLPNLHILDLNGNNIGRGGFITISNLLQKEGSTLTWLDLSSTGMGDNEAEILASSLKHNNTLKNILLIYNNIGEKGLGALLKLLNDVTSIESTYNSNHTLTTCTLTRDVIGTGGGRPPRLIHMINHACAQNDQSNGPNAAGRAKVIHSQMNCQTRKQYCQWQGIEYSSIGHLLADIDIKPVHLPNIFAMIGQYHDVSSFYTALVPTAPDVLSFIDRKVMLKDAIDVNTSDTTALDAEFESQVAALKARYSHQRSLLTTKRSELETRLAHMETREGSQSKNMSEHKRQKC